MNFDMQQQGGQISIQDRFSLILEQLTQCSEIWGIWISAWVFRLLFSTFLSGNLMVRCAENIINNDVSVSFHFFQFFRELDDFEHVVSSFFGVHLEHFGTQNSDFGRLGTVLEKYRFLTVSLNGPRLREHACWKVKCRSSPSSYQLPIPDCRSSTDQLTG